MLDCASHCTDKDLHPLQLHRMSVAATLKWRELKS